MRVAFYAPMKAPDHPVPSGDRAIARLFMAALAAAGREAELICHFSSRDGTGDPSRQARLRAVGTALADRLAARLRRRPPHHRPAAWLTYHLYHKAPDWLGPAVCQQLRIPYLIAEASVAAKQAGGPWDIGFDAARQAVAAAQRIFLLNPNDAAGLTPHLAATAKIVPTAPFLDPTPYRAAATQRSANRRRLAHRHDLPAGDTWLLAVAMMRPGDKQASYDLLSAALNDLPATGWQLLVVGDGAHRPEIISALQQAAKGRLHWLGAQSPEAMPEIYAACDIMVWPAVREAIGMALLEAQATGLPVIAGTAGGVAGIVEPGVSGLLTPAGDVAAFAAAIGHLLADRPLRDRMAAAAAAHVLRHHSLGAAATLLDRTLTELVPAP